MQCKLKFQYSWLSAKSGNGLHISKTNDKATSKYCVIFTSDCL